MKQKCRCQASTGACAGFVVRLYYEPGDNESVNSNASIRFRQIFADNVDPEPTIKEGQRCLEEQDEAPDGLGDGPQGAPPGGERRAAAAAEDDG